MQNINMGKLNVLIVGSKQPQDFSGTVDTINNLFQYNDDTNKLFISFSDFPERCKYEFNISHYFSPTLVKCLKSLRRYLREKSLKTSSNRTNSDEKGKGDSCFKKRKLVSIFKDVLNFIIDVFPNKFSRNQLELIADFSPTNIYTYGTNITNFRIAIKLSKVFNIPITVHVMDSWYRTVYSDCFVAKKILFFYLKKALTRGQVHFSSSEPIADGLREIFPGVVWEILPNPIDCSESVNLEKPYPSKNKNEIRLLYAGSISLNRWKSLASIQTWINEFAEIGGRRVLFDIYIPPTMMQSQEALILKNKGAIVRPYVSKSELSTLYNSHDVLILVESFDKQLECFTRDSFSTKVPEYLFSGKQIIAYMPKDFYTAHLLESERMGFVCSNADEFYNCLTSALRVKCKSKRQVAYAVSHFSREVICKKAITILRKTYL